MYRSVGTHLPLFLLFAFFFCLITTEAKAEEQGKTPPASKVLQQRIDFGNAQILGQSIKSGAVYLMHRKKSDIKNMLEVRANYREEIKEDFDLEKTAISQNAVEKKKDPK
jgi:hypothetical protein